MVLARLDNIESMISRLDNRKFLSPSARVMSSSSLTSPYKVFQQNDQMIEASLPSYSVIEQPDLKWKNYGLKCPKSQLDIRLTHQ